MTQTAQTRSLPALHKAEKDLPKNEPENEDNMRLLLKVYDNLNELYEKLNRLCNVINNVNKRREK